MKDDGLSEAKKKLPLVSVIVPVYNVGNYVRDCLDSLLRQDYRNTEFLLIDDGSTDDSVRVCEEYCAKDSRVRLFSKENGGLSSARNYGIDRAQGAYLVFVDSDDVVAPSFVQDLVSPMIENRAVDISICSFDSFVDTPSVPAVFREDLEWSFIDAEEALKRLCTEGISVKYEVAWNKAYKASLFKTVKYAEGLIHEDTATTYKLFAVSRDIAVSDRSLYFYRQRPGSIMNTDFSKKDLDIVSILFEREMFFRKLGLDLSIANWAFSLNTLMRTYYRARGTGFEEDMLRAYCDMYKLGVSEKGYKANPRLMIQYRLPRICSLAYRLKMRINNRKRMMVYEK